MNIQTLKHKGLQKFPEAEQSKPYRSVMFSECCLSIFNPNSSVNFKFLFLKMPIKQ